MGIFLKLKNVYLNSNLKRVINDKIHSLINTHTLPVSPYSAIKIKGVPFYKLARRAERKKFTILDLPMKTMCVLNLKLMSIKEYSYKSVHGVMVKVIFDVESGTYIRSLAEELGKK